MPSLFPVQASSENRHRHDPWDAIALHHIYRDPWERKYEPTKPLDERDVRSVGDYPELEDMFNQLNSLAKAHPESAFTWGLSAQQQAFPWMRRGRALPAYPTI